MSFFTTLLIFILIISFLVFIHELGHFLAAKFVGIKVEEFAIGMGPKIFGFNFLNTDFNLRLLPIGGYVKLYGEGDYDLIDKDSYAGKPPLHRLLVLFGGVLMNFLFVVMFFYIKGFFVDFNYRNINVINNQTSVWFGEELPQRIIVLDFLNDSVLKDKVSKFDILIKIDDKQYQDIDDLQKILISKSNTDVKLTFIPYDSNIEKEVFIKVPKVNKNLIGVNNSSLVTVRTIKEDSPLFGKINELDTILKINGQDYDIKNFTSIISKLKGQEVEFLVYRESSPEEFTVKLSIPDKQYPLGISYMPSIGLEYLIGVDIGIVSLNKFDGISKITAGFAQTLNLTKQFFLIMQHLLERSFKLGNPAPVVDNMAGVIGLFQILELMISLLGFWGVLELMAVLSLNLVIFNLLPIPALDGGHILFTFIELILGKRLNTDLYNKITFLGFVFLLILMIFVTFLDLVRFTPLRNFVCNESFNLPFVCELKLLSK